MRLPSAKSYAPRSLYGRAALILVLPVIVLQLVVSVVFIQRHYEGVTRQMTQNLAPLLGEALRLIEQAETLEAGQAAAAPILSSAGISVTKADGDGVERVSVFDLAGRELVSTLHASLTKEIAVDLMRDSRVVHLYQQSRHGLLDVTFRRKLATASNPHQLLVIMLAASFLMTLISFLFMRNQLRPIRQLARAASAFGKGQTIDYRPAGAAEVRDAGLAFLDMRNRIERHLEQRTLMLSGVSHDLRTPITRLKLALSLLDEKTAQGMQSDVEDMERLITEFLDFARGDALEEAEEVDLGALCAGLVSRYDKARVTYGGAEGGAVLSVRPMALTRAIENLLNNALRYGTRAELRVIVSETTALVRIDDDGPGIPQERRDEALRPFIRLDPARNQDRGGGVGLGLAIAADVARRHGGTLRLSESAHLGGLRVELVLAKGPTEAG